MLVEKLSENDIRLIDDYRRNYAYSNDANVGHNSFMGVDYILREWDARKSEYLYRLLGEQLTISKFFNYEKSYEELADEISDFTNHRYGRAGRSGYDFVNNYFKLVYPSISEVNYHFPEPVKEGLNCLMGDESLIDNKYHGSTFEMPLPNGKNLKIANGCKTSRMLGKIADAYDIPGFEDFRICHSQVLNQKNIGGTLTLSIHPLDYMTMSDNDCGWESCMSWREEGGYRQGTVEMMNSPCVVVAYLAAEQDMLMYPHCGGRGDNDHWNNKKWRQLFIVNNDLILSVKDYPYHNEHLTTVTVNWLRELAQKNLNWTYDEVRPYSFSHNSSKIYLDYLPEEKDGFYLEILHNNMYNDLGCLDEHYLCINANLDPEQIKSTKYSSSRWLNVQYSGASECMVCGCLNTDFENESCLACQECQNMDRCDICGEVIYGDNYGVDGVCLCEYCWDNRTRECTQCGAYHLDEDMVGIHIIPRITPKQNKKLFKQYKKDHPYDDRLMLKQYDEDPDFKNMVFFSDSTDVYLCDEDRCFENWIKDNLVEGARPHCRHVRWRNCWYVYYDELTEDAKDEWCWGWDGSLEQYQRQHRYNRPFPSSIIEDDKSSEGNKKMTDDDLPF